LAYYATNPCPCGYHNHPDKECVCGPGVVKRYVSKISGPLLDRIDLHVEVTPVSYDELTTTERTQVNSRDIRARVLQCRRSGSRTCTMSISSGKKNIPPTYKLIKSAESIKKTNIPPTYSIYIPAECVFLQ